jgi:hypothetical protein
MVVSMQEVVSMKRNTAVVTGIVITVTADNSQLAGSSNGLYLGATRLDGGATNSRGTLTCSPVCDGSYGDYTCP